jgi:nitroreductase
MYRPLDDDSIARRILGAAGAAPSIHNTQPWRFEITGPDLIELHGDPDRMLWVADPRGRALHLSCGTALFNLRLAIRASGARPLVWPLPDPEGEPTLLASVQLAEGRPVASVERELFESIERRHTSRVPFSDRPVSTVAQRALEDAAATEFTMLRTLADADAALAMRLAAAADRELAGNFDHRVELCRWIGTETADGVPVPALGSRPEHEPAPVRDFGYTTPAHPRLSGTFETSPQLAVLATARDEPEDWLRAGQALQRVLLTATVNGLVTSFLYQPMELHDIQQSGDGWWPWPEYPQIVIRFGYGPPGAHTARRPVADTMGRSADGRRGWSPQPGT